MTTVLEAVVALSCDAATGRSSHEWMWTALDLSRDKHINHGLIGALPVLLQLEGVIWNVHQDDFRGPPAVVKTTYHVLWDEKGSTRSKNRNLEVRCE